MRVLRGIGRMIVWMGQLGFDIDLDNEVQVPLEEASTVRMQKFLVEAVEERRKGKEDTKEESEDPVRTATPEAKLTGLETPEVQDHTAPVVVQWRTVKESKLVLLRWRQQTM